jgi:ubiquinone/menaquinone biosynthesis C-methylase UbiE
MSIWGRIFAASYDRFTAKAERDCFADHRRTLLADAGGDVLEIGGGTGANLPYYGDGVRTLTVTEPDPAMSRRLAKHVGSVRPDAKVLRAPAEDLPFNDDTFDTVVCTLVLCTVDDQPRALRELRRVLRHDGQFLFIEHVRSDDEKVARLQDRMLPLNVRLMRGCHCNRPTVESVRSAGFEITRLASDTIPHAPKFVGPLVVGTAVYVAAPAQAAA